MDFLLVIVILYNPVRTNLKVDSLTITNEDLSPSHQVMSSGYTSIGGRHDSQSSNKLRLPQT